VRNPIAIVMEMVMATFSSVMQKEPIFVATNGWIPIPRILPRPYVTAESALLMLAVKEPHPPHLPHKNQKIAGKCAKEQQVKWRSEILVAPVTTAAARMVLVRVQSALKARDFVTKLGDAVLVVAVLKHVVNPPPHLPQLLHPLHLTQKIATRSAKERGLTRWRSEIFVALVTTAAVTVVLVAVISAMKARDFVTSLENAVSVVALLKHVVCETTVIY